MSRRFMAGGFLSWWKAASLAIGAVLRMSPV